VVAAGPAESVSRSAHRRSQCLRWQQPGRSLALPAPSACPDEVAVEAHAEPVLDLHRGRLLRSSLATRSARSECTATVPSRRLSLGPPAGFPAADQLPQLSDQLVERVVGPRVAPLRGRPRRWRGCWVPTMSTPPSGGDSLSWALSHRKATAARAVSAAWSAFPDGAPPTPTNPADLSHLDSSSPLDPVPGAPPKADGC